MLRLKSSDNNLIKNKNLVREIPINAINPNPYQPRKTFKLSELEDLSKSIEQYGIIQPITVRKFRNGKYELITGERRLRASKILKRKHIPAIIVEGNDQDSAIIAMVENLQRKNLNFFEEAEGYESILINQNMTQEILAEKIGKNQSTIANKLRLLRLSTNIKKKILANDLTERHARALLRIPIEKKQEEILDQVIERNYNVRETEMRVNRELEKMRLRSAKDRKLVKKTSKDIRIFVNTINDSVKMMKQYGLRPKVIQKDNEDTVEIIVIIPKN